ncbi:MAG: hypothetical protein AAB701_01625 [Patescibacteria group bacterium]
MTDEEMEATTGEPAPQNQIECRHARYRATSFSNNWWRLIPPPYPYQRQPIYIPVMYR